MVTSFVKGLQGDNPKYWLTASLMKHFFANSNENGRDSSSSDFDEQLFREYYSVPFRMGVEDGGSRAYMAAYNSYNGIPCTVNPILKNVTVKEWGQNGIICTDGGAFQLLVTSHKYYPDLNEAAAGCIHAGIGQFLDRYREGVYGALANKFISESDIDSVLRGNFRVMIKLGQLDPPEMVPYNKIGITDTIEPWLTKDHMKLAREVTQKTIVLLKNDNNTLPLNKKTIKSVAVIGPNANKVWLDWYSGTPPYTVSPLEGIRNKVGKSVNVYFAATNKYDSAVIAAKKADIAIVCVGNHPTCDAGWADCPDPGEGKEAVDRLSLDLAQEELVRQVYQANPNTIVVLISSFPYAINWTQKNIPAIVHMTHSSEELGNALADVLFGEYNPAGRLVQTWPSSIDQLPDMMDYNIRHGRTYMYMKDKPLYPFGYGLSYTTFKYSGMKVSSSKLKKDGEISVSVDVTNTGKLAGDEVVQLYIQFPGSGIERPIKELRGFKRINIMPGETKTVRIPLKAKDLAYWNTSQHRFVVEDGKINLQLGASSEDIKLEKTINVAE